MTNFSSKVLKSSYDIELQISGLNLYHSLIVCGK